MNKNIVFGIIGLVLMASAGYAFDLVELQSRDVVNFGNGDIVKIFKVHAENSTDKTTDDYYTLAFFYNATEKNTIQLHKDGSWNVNGKGVCLEDGTSSMGGDCKISNDVNRGLPEPVLTKNNK